MPFLDRVEADEVDVAGSALEEARKRRGMRKIAVFARDEAVFKNVPPPRLLKITGAGIEDIGDLIGVRNGHGAGALFVRDCVQRYGEIERDPLLGEPPHLRHQPAGGERDVARAHAKPLFRRDVAQKPHDVFVIIERLAAAHEHDVRNGALLFRAALGTVDGEHLA